jgi:hypothetical protein
MHKRVIRVAVLGLLVFAFTVFHNADTANACWKKDKRVVGWWKFDEGVGTFVGDSSGLGNDGSLIGDAAFTTDALKGSAADLYGSSGSVRIPHDPSLEPAMGTIEVWIKIGYNHDADVVMKTTTHMVRSGVSGSFSVYGLRILVDGGVQAFIANDDAPPGGTNHWTFVRSSDGLIIPGQWHHLALRWDGSEVAVFVDGVKQASQSYLAIPGSGLSYFSDQSDFGLGIGTQWSSTGDRELIGQLDEVRVINGALSDSEIELSYKSRGGNFVHKFKKNKKNKKPKKSKLRQNKNGKWNNGKTPKHSRRWRWKK